MNVLEELQDVLLLIYEPDDALIIFGNACQKGMSEDQQTEKLMQELRTATQYIMLENEALWREINKLKGQ